VAYWLFPIPNQQQVWPQFRSPLLWDVFAWVLFHRVAAVLVHGHGAGPGDFPRSLHLALRRIIYGLLAWLARLQPAVAALREGLLAAGRTCHAAGAQRAQRGELRFATSQLPGWHTTIFPPYFVAGAIFGGFAMVVTLAVPARQIFGLKQIITLHH